MQLDEFILRITLNSSDFTKGATEVKATLEKAKDSIVSSGEKIEDAGKKVVESAKESTAAIAKAHEDIGKSTDAAARKAKEASETTTRGHKETTKAAKNGADQLSKMAREALGLFAIFSGGQSIKGFVSDITASDAALGRFSANMGVAPQIASAWGLAAERMGGSARATEESVSGLYTKLWRMKEFGQEMPQEYWRLAARGGISLDRTKDAYAQTMQLATAVRNIAGAEGRTSAYMWGSSVGFDEGTVNLIIGAGNRLNEILRETKEISAGDRDVRSAQERQTAWSKLTQEIQNTGRAIVTELTPSIIGALDWMAKLTAEIKTELGSENGHAAAPFLRRWQSLLQSTLPASWFPTRDEAQSGSTGQWQRLKRVFGGGWASIGGIDRSSFARELEYNPALREKVLAISLGENKNPAANQAVFESMMNRAAVNKTSAAQEARLTGEGGYYAGYDPEALRNTALRAMAEENLRKVLAGSDISHGATDNASGRFAAGRFAPGGMFARSFSAGGETFGYPNRQDARGFNQYPAWYSGAGFSAMNSSSSSVSNSSAETHFNGPINITLPMVTDAQSFAAAWPDAMRNAGYAAAFNAGAQ